MQSQDRRAELLERAYRRGYALRRRHHWIVTLATLAMIVVVGSAVFAVTKPSEKHTLSVVPTTTTTPAGCASAPAVVPAADVPDDVAAWASGAPVIGGRDLWTARSALEVAPAQGAGGWTLKFPWFTKPNGLPRIDGRRVDGYGTFHAEVDKATLPDGTDFVASSLEFSGPGCWEITARYFDPTSPLVFRLQVGVAQSPDADFKVALRALGVNLDRAPTDAVDLGAAKFCGVEVADNTQPRKYNEAARRCFLDQRAGHAAAVFVLQQTSVEGDPIATIYRSKSDGSVDLFTDATRDKFGSGKWETSTCGTLQTDFPDAPATPPPYYFDGAQCTASTTAPSP